MSENKLIKSDEFISLFRNENMRQEILKFDFDRIHISVVEMPWSFIDLFCVESFEIDKEKFNSYCDKLNNEIEENIKRVDILKRYSIYDENSAHCLYPTKKINKNEINNINLNYFVDEIDISNFLFNSTITTKLHFSDTLHYLFDSNHNYVSLKYTPGSIVRRLGINIEESSKIIYKSNLFDELIDYDLLFKKLSKEDLFKLAEELNIDVKKSYSKKIVVELIDVNNDEINKILKKKAQDYSKENFLIKPNNRIYNFYKWRKEIYQLFKFLFLRSVDSRYFNF